MKSGRFIWADLSTYDTSSSVEFYENVFGWEVSNLSNYFLAKQGSRHIAGIFETPEFLKKIKMPHFWMSYFQVDSTPKAVDMVKSIGAKIEVDSTEFNNGNIALIRDPQGAGFTVYDGKELYFAEEAMHGSIIKTELHVSNIENVLPFYKALFDWQLIGSGNDLQVSYDNVGSNISLRKISNAVKGKFEYWVITILVDKISVTTQKILKEGGSIISQEGHRNLMVDNSNEAFFYIQEN